MKTVDDIRAEIGAGDARDRKVEIFGSPDGTVDLVFCEPDGHPQYAIKLHNPDSVREIATKLLKAADFTGPRGEAVRGAHMIRVLRCKDPGCTSVHFWLFDDDGDCFATAALPVAGVPAVIADLEQVAADLGGTNPQAGHA